ncbi:MAG TPA: helix-turn-helix transcriptional regulator [Candidatus Cybelea sp.]|jgi:DNA-binding CsgD family transcriptional regulator
MRDLERAVAAISPAGFGGFDASRKRRLEASLRRASRAAAADGWAIGVFDSAQDLVAFEISEAGIDERCALALLSRMPYPSTAGPIILNATSHECDNVPAALGIATDTGKGHSVALVFVPRDRYNEGWAEAAQAIRLAASAVIKEIAAFDFASEGKRTTPIAGAPHAFFLLNADLDVQFAWSSPVKEAAAFARLVEPQEGRMPLFLEQSLRRLTSSWSFARPGTCVARTGYPLCGLAMRVVPILRREVYIGVFLDRCEDPDIDAVATTYRFSPREREVLHALLDGGSITEIASELNVAASTVNDHVSRMVAKTNARNRIQMAATLLGWSSVRPEQQRARERPASKSRLPERGEETVEQERPRCSWRYHP